MMEWAEIPIEWRKCFEIAWESFQEGARPIGAIVVNGQGKIISDGKSSVFQETSRGVIAHNELAHAELNALLKIDNRIHKNVKDYTLYTTMEPCPLCFSSLYMSGVRNLAYAAKDKYGGSTNLVKTTPYLSKKSIHIHGPVPNLDNLSILLHIYYDLELDYEKGPRVHSEMEKDYPFAVELARTWSKDNHMRTFTRIEDVYEALQNHFSLLS